MFSPNSTCVIQSSDGKSDDYGMPLPVLKTTERCTVVKLTLTIEKSSVRADSSASRGNAIEEEALSKILLTKNTKAQMNDIIILPECKLRIVGRIPRFDLQGRPDHVEVAAQFWSKA
ncbi:hypothetical protein RGU72_05005 [Undibacterium sp. 5I1]|uniref:hypothetical protein n=1 Tax=unclassified Undibacterium TaxID=2630295 RepID=UPI002AB406EE|nr:MULTISPECIES: hypothetical protein [unclassified Undibacterium]MDY7537612.1 hypothetical protein [Undibacterium sp. 5I1]MEB0230157.1 hypothetical protein [Undibacterium sp. 10I3]MEB0256349.1 hypothetical protein [Undibacterium sp. 5I1]